MANNTGWEKCSLYIHNENTVSCTSMLTTSSCLSSIITRTERRQLCLVAVECVLDDKDTVWGMVQPQWDHLPPHSLIRFNPSTSLHWHPHPAPNINTTQIHITHLRLLLLNRDFIFMGITFSIQCSWFSSLPQYWAQIENPDFLSFFKFLNFYEILKMPTEFNFEIQ